MNVIRFYRVDDKFGCFSNFSQHSVYIDCQTWRTTEHYFQAQKFAGTEREKEIQAAKTPRIAANMGRDRNFPLRTDWEQVKDDIMRKAVMAKFTQYDDLRKTLLNTGNAILVEHTKNDSYWGDGGDGTGKNMLGKILMETRAILKEKVMYKVFYKDLLEGVFFEERMADVFIDACLEFSDYSFDYFRIEEERIKL